MVHAKRECHNFSFVVGLGLGQDKIGRIAAGDTHS